jgi:hypothetical protein
VWQWEFRNGEADSPVSCALESGTGAELETSASMRVNVSDLFILSFVLTVDGRNYAGWPADAGDAGIEVDRYGLGYVTIDPDELAEFNQAVAANETIDPAAYPVLVMVSSLGPNFGAQVSDWANITPTFLVTITDSGAVEFALAE